MMVMSVDAWHAEVPDSPQFKSAHFRVISLFQTAHIAVSTKLIEISRIGNSFGLFDHII
jgi:hypothetical protein